MTADDIASRIAAVRERVRAAVARRGAGPSVTLIGVSKLQPIDALERAYAAGLRDFGENYGQELRDKLAALPHADLRWHFIGALQSNKIKYVVGRTLIHTVDRPQLLPLLAARATNQSVIQEVLVEVKLDPTREAGVAASQVGDLLDGFAAHPGLRCVGLMIIPPEGSPEQTRAHFAGLRRLRDQLAAVARPGVALRELSMGMSADFEAAIEEGATLVRVGTAIFGERP